MATIEHINKDAYAAKALELLKNRMLEFESFALGLLKADMTREMVVERLEDKVRSEMKNVLFNFLKRSGKVKGNYRYQYYHVTGCYRAVRREPQKSEVPSHLLDIKEILTDYKDIISDIMLEAEKKWVIGQIEATAKDAKENNDEKYQE